MLLKQVVFHFLLALDLYKLLVAMGLDLELDEGKLEQALELQTLHLDH